MIVTVTVNPSLDRVVETGRVEPDHKLRCRTQSLAPGGGGVNVSRVVRRMGVDTVALWMKGGPAGARYAKLLDEEEVVHQSVTIENETRETWTATETAEGRQYRFVLEGPQVSSDERDAMLKLAETCECEYLVASGSLPPGVDTDFFCALGERAADRGARFVLDTSGEALRSGLACRPYLLKPNLRELEQLAGRELPDDDAIERSARQLIDEHGVEVVVVSLGAGGVLLATGDGSRRYSAPTVKIRSKVGAGDSTVGGIVSALAQGRAIEDAVQFGVACGAAAVMTDGIDLCHREDAERLFKRVTMADSA